MKTPIKMTITLLLIQVATFGQDTDGIISAKEYLIHAAYNIDPKTSDTLDKTESFTSENGYIILLNHAKKISIFSVQKSEDEALLIGCTHVNNNLEEKDSMVYFSTKMAKGTDSLKNITITKKYFTDSFEDTGERYYSFQFACATDIWYFITTEIITGKKD
jgi:hypothetical protein